MAVAHTLIPVPGAPLRHITDHSHHGFLSYLPIVERHARITFRHLREEAKEEAIAEAVAGAYCNYAAAVQRGRSSALKPSMVARFAVLRVKDGGHVGGSRERRREVLNPKAARSGNFKVHRLRDARDYIYDCLASNDHAVWRLVLLEDRRTPVADQAAFRLDWGSFLSRQSDRVRQIIAALAAGHRRCDVADRFGISASALTQRMNRLHRAWLAFQGMTSITQSSNSARNSGRRHSTNHSSRDNPQHDRMTTRACIDCSQPS